MHAAEKYVETARELASLVATHTERIERERRIPQDVVEPLIDAGLFRLLLPQSLGGAEMAHPDFLKIVRIFAEVDASVAWCVNQNNVFSTNAVRVSASVAEEIWADPRTIVTNGPPQQSSGAKILDNGYKLTGRWDFSSGIPHANWVAALAPIEGDGSSATPEMGTFLIPKNEVEIIDQWHVGGLRGTGSLSFTASGVFVPCGRSYPQDASSREPGPLYVIHTTPLFASGFATVALGSARTALDDAIEFVKSKTLQGSKNVLSADSTTHRTLGLAEAQWSSANSFLNEATDSMWDEVIGRHELTTQTRVKVRLASTHAIRSAATVVDAAYTLFGSNAIFNSSPIQRRYQDIHAITQQIQGRMTHYDTAGRFALGLGAIGII